MSAIFSLKVYFARTEDNKLICKRLITPDDKQYTDNPIKFNNVQISDTSYILNHHNIKTNKYREFIIQMPSGFPITSDIEQLIGLEIYVACHVKYYSFTDRKTGYKQSGNNLILEAISAKADLSG
jgi:hypothetical protein